MRIDELFQLIYPELAREQNQLYLEETFRNAKKDFNADVKKVLVSTD